MAGDMGAKSRILVVDDEPGLRDMLAILFRREGFDVTLAPGCSKGVDVIRATESPFSLVLSDLVMPDGSGLDLLAAAKDRSKETEVIIMTAHSRLETAVEGDARRCLRLHHEALRDGGAPGARPQGAREACDRRREPDAARAARARPSTRSPRPLRADAPHRRPRAARREDPEHRAHHRRERNGKERIARAIHDLSDRAEKPFLVVNCGAMPESLMESELFGHDKGAFTGATSRHQGLFRDAEGGTVLLDEVGELPLSLQVKLLRVLQERKVRSVGGSAETSVDVRILAATNRNVEDDVKSGKFRQDLYYRLNIIRVEVPPLRDRREDIADLTDAFLKRCVAEHGKGARSFSQDALRALDAYAFPGNVRELENIVERAVTLSSAAVIGLGDLPFEVSGATARPTPALSLLPEEGCRLDEVLGELERRLILQAIERADGSRAAAAKLLGVSLRSLRYRLQKLSMGDGEDVEADSAQADEPPSS